MSEPSTYPQISGQEVQTGDVATLGAVSGLADDRLLAELLRLAPYAGGAAYRAIVGNTSSAGGPPYTQPVVVPALGGVGINLFRAVVGSRNTPSAANLPAGNLGAIWGESSPLAWWRDIRSGVFSQRGAGGGSIYNIALTANSSGNPRWDLIYAVIQPDTSGPAVTRRVKNPNTGVIASMSVAQYLYSPVTVSVVTGTPGATPTPPPCPADSSTAYYIPIAWVRVPNGFTSASTPATTDIRPTVTNVVGSSVYAGISQFRQLSQPFEVDVCTGSNDIDATYATNFPWNASAGGRPGPFMPPEWRGGKVLILEADWFTLGSYSHPNGSIIDSSQDWRNRLFLVYAQGGANKLATDQSGGTTTRVPYGSTLSTANLTQMSSSFSADANLVAGTSTVISMSPSNMASFAAGSAAGIVVSQSTGQLLAWTNATSTSSRVAFWIFASAQFPNA
jgi:hypothetical protein